MLERAQGLGFLGPGPVEDHLRHAEAFAAAVAPPDVALDLGSGGGVPGLALAATWRSSRWVLLDSNARRGAFLEQVIGDLQLGDRVIVVVDRAERAARDDRWRGTFDLVVARSFGSPAVAAECAAGFLRIGGHLLVSEPPSDTGERWPEQPLADLGLVDRGRKGQVRVLELSSSVADKFPRRVGVPTKRPLW